MNQLDQAQQNTGKIILLGHSTAWLSAIQRLTLPVELTHAVNLDDLVDEASQHFGSIGLVEFISDQNPGELCRKIAQIAIKPCQLRLVALGTSQTDPWLSLARISGFSLILPTVLHANRLPSFIENHFRSVEWPELELETRIESRLPWPIRTPKP